ncbi:oil body-associated protein 2A-like [Bidens hawaiensis]|uniref:oil body-associated protein 2A-like n=1 Tax=Bidens hawaiensis TaxID=980011 RepID=UPI00404A874E
MPVGDGKVTPGKPMTVGDQVINKSAQMLQSLKPIKQMSQHVCTFAVYGHDMSRQIEAHHYITRLNQDFLQSAVYDSNEPSANLIGDRLPLGAPALMMSPQIVNMGVIKPELVHVRDNKFKISTEELKKSRANIPVSNPGNARVADYWMHIGKGFAIDIEQSEMKMKEPQVEIKMVEAPKFP